MAPNAAKGLLFVELCPDVEVIVETGCWRRAEMSLHVEMLLGQRHDAKAIRSNVLITTKDHIHASKIYSMPVTPV